MLTDSDIDPEFFIQFAMRLMPDSSSMQPCLPVGDGFPGAMMTPFEMAFSRRTVMHTLPMHEALLNIPLSCEAEIVTNLFVLPLENALVSAAVESCFGSERMMGVFISCNNPFVLDVIADLQADGQREAAKKEVVAKATKLLRPMLSADTIALLGSSLGADITAIKAERIAQSFVDTLMTAARCADTKRNLSPNPDPDY